MPRGTEAGSDQPDAPDNVETVEFASLDDLFDFISTDDDQTQNRT